MRRARRALIGASLLVAVALAPGAQRAPDEFAAEAQARADARAGAARVLDADGERSAPAQGRHAMPASEAERGPAGHSTFSSGWPARSAAPAPAGATESAAAPTTVRADRAAPRLDAPIVRHDRLTAHLTGTDPVGGRVVRLWRVDAGGAEIVASARSDATGRFDLGHVPIPNRDYAVAVTADGAPPAGAALARVSMDRPAAPVATALPDPDTLMVRIQPAAPGGELHLVRDGRPAERLAAEGGALLWRPDARDLLQDVDVVHVLPDGRRSEAVAIYRRPRTSPIPSATR